MAADLPENYNAFDAFQFIKDVATTGESNYLEAEPDNTLLLLVKRKELTTGRECKW
jgi:hypothetical protein